VAITGCTSGVGLILAQTCGRLGARVLMLNRPSERADAALQKLRQANVDCVLVPCDLQSVASVRECGAEVKRLCSESGLDVFVNNAGVMALPDQATRDGFDVQMQSNHLSHYLLTSLVYPALQIAARQRGEARVVNQSSGARRGPPLDAKYLGKNGGNLGGDGGMGTGKWRRYQQSKLANLLFTYALHEQGRKQNVPQADRILVLCAHPGPTDSGLQGKLPNQTTFDRFLLAKTLRDAHSAEDGASGITRGCCEAGVESLAFYGPAGKGKSGPAVLLPQERNAAGEELLWKESLRAVGIDDFFASARQA